LITLLRTVDTLRSLLRIGWIQRSVNRCEAEDVGSHILLTSYIGLVLCHEYRRLCMDKVNCDKVCTMCLIHDVQESLIGNIAGDVRRIIRDFKNIELRKLEELFKDFPQTILKNIGTYFLEYRESSSIEAILVRLSDKLATLLRAYYYAKRGLKDVLDLVRYYSNEVRNLLNYVRCSSFRDVLEKILSEIHREINRSCSS